VPVTVYLTVALFVENRGTWFLPVLVPWAWYSIFVSGCRTALLAAGLSAVATVASLVVFPRVTRGFGQLRSVMLKICLVALFAVAVFATSTSVLSSAFDKFITKGSRNGAVASSRRMQMDRLMSSIGENLFTGIGFGLSPGSVGQVTLRDELTGLPVSAPTEQGFLPLAALSQLGAIGTVPLTLFLFVLAMPIVKRGPPAVVAMFWTALFVNFGEMIFFSTGGLGMHMWLLIACCYGQSVTGARPGRV
jgi:hypothetical protein